MAHPDKRTIGTAGVAAAIFAVASIVIVSRVGGPVVVRDVDDVCQGLAAVTGATAAALGVRRHRGRERWGWSFLAAGLAAWAGGQGVWCWYEVGRGVAAPFPSLADAGFLSFSLLATVGMFLLQETTAGGRVRALLDGMIVGASLLDLSWKTALGVTVKSASFGFSTAVSVAYPIGDIMLLTMAVQMLSRSRARRLPLAIIAAAALALALADSGFTYLSALDRYHTGDLIDLGWVGGFGLMGVAAAVAGARTRASRVSRVAPELTESVAAPAVAGRPVAARRPVAGAPPATALTAPALVWLPYAVMLVVGGVLVGLHITGHKSDTVEIRVTGALLLLVLVRQYFYVRDHQDLVRALGARERAFAHQAFHDDLTGLPNRALLHQQVAEVVEGVHGLPGDPVGALLFCDLDDFKLVNDTLGHGAGDELLAEVACRMRRVIRPGDLRARRGGAEFAVLAVGTADPVEIAGRLLRVLHEPVEVGGQPAQVHASIGVRALVAGEGATPSDILADADAAMYAAKRDGKGGIRVYDPALRDNEVDGLDLQRDISAALVAGEITAAYQPIVDPRTGVACAVEVLARWSRRGVPVPPAVFVPLAERLGLMTLLTDAMLDTGLTQLAEWSVSLGRPDLGLAVNVSATELRPDHGLPRRVGTALARHRLDAARLTLEVTESAVAPDEPGARQVLGELRALGCRVAVDDFGVGHSSLARLHRFPIDVLKLDAAIIRGADTDPAQALILDSVTTLGESLGLEVVVEGVETEAQLAQLRSGLGTPLVQGYALARPAPAADVAALLARVAPAERVDRVDAFAGSSAPRRP
ncbi:MAG: putative bifunctional diguanylate cyclase/phosphodiesterase [Acidimicrobiales bacterium]